MRFISDVQYYMDTSQDVDKIVSDYSLLVNGTGDYLDGCVVEFFQVDSASKVRNGNQMMFNPSGGHWNQGYLQYTANANDDQDKKFVLKYFSGDVGKGRQASGYYLWPNNNVGNNTVMLFPFLPSKDDEDARVSASTKWEKGATEIQRLFNFTPSTNDKKRFIVSMSVQSMDKGTYNIGVNTQSEVTSRPAPSPLALWEVKFLSLGKKTWTMLMKNDPTNSVKYKGCFKDEFNLDAYPNYMDAFDELKVDCNAGKPSICENSLGFDDKGGICKAFCNMTGNEIKCLPNFKKWCNKPENINKKICSCFDLEGYKKFNCPGGKCQYDEALPHCYYPECILNSGMARVYNADKPECPRSSVTYQQCIQNITDSTLTADQIKLQCDMNSSNGTPGSGGSTPGPGGSTPGSGGSSGSEEPSWFSKYGGYMIGGIALVVVLIIIAAVVMNKNAAAPVAAPAI